MYQKTVLFGFFIFSLLLTSCDPESLPETKEGKVNSQLDIVGDSGNEEAPIDDGKDD